LFGLGGNWSGYTIKK